MRGFTDRSETDYRANWRTPSDALDVVRRGLGGVIGLDPCASPDPADHFALENWNPAFGTDGLVLPWLGPAFVNPEFNRNALWTAKCVAEARRGVESILLIPSRTDTRYFQGDIATARAVCFWRGRIRFVGAKDPAKFPVAFAYWGPNVERFEEAFKPHGLIYRS